MRAARKFVIPLLVAIAALACWYGLRLWIERAWPERLFLLPTPGEVLAAARQERATLAAATANTVVPALAGLAAAVVFSVGCSLLLAVSPIARAGLFPYLMALQMTPIIVVTPILLLWIGPGWLSVSTITFLVCFFPLVVNTTQGLVSTDHNLVELFRLNRATRWQELRHLRFPSALPYFFTGLRISAVLAPIGAVTGDFFAGNSAGGVGGLGFMTVLYSARLQIPALFATAALCCLLGFVLVGAIYALSWTCLHTWHDAYRKES